MPSIELMTSAWHDERRISLRLPVDWDVRVIQGDSLPPLSDDALRAAIRSPVGGAPLSQLAREAATAAIVIDDMTRPTPLKQLLPILLQELQAAGVRRDAVTVFLAGGTHAVAGEADIRRKVGTETFESVRVVAHDMRRSPLRDLGRSSRGTPILANAQMLDCDLKLGVGGLYPHPVAGFSGGSKLIAPGLCSFETARHLHDRLGGDDCRGSEQINVFRSDIEEIAGRIGLGFVVNVMLNFERKIAAAFSGDRISVQRHGVSYVRSAYTVEDRLEADVFMSDAYPFDSDFHYAYDRGGWPLTGRTQGSIGVLLASCPTGAGHHELDRPLAERLANRIRTLRPSEIRRFPQRVRNLHGILKRRSTELIVVSDGLDATAISAAQPHAVVVPDWDAAVGRISRRLQKPSPRVVIYRCAPLHVPASQR